MDGANPIAEVRADGEILHSGLCHDGDESPSVARHIADRSRPHRHSRDIAKPRAEAGTPLTLRRLAQSACCTTARRAPRQPRGPNVSALAAWPQGNDPESDSFGVHLKRMPGGLPALAWAGSSLLQLPICADHLLSVRDPCRRVNGVAATAPEWWRTTVR
jgi:hypothetical protein